MESIYIYLWQVLARGFKMLEKIVLGKARMAIFDRDHLVSRLSEKAMRNENGLAIARLGPPIPFLHSNLAVFVPKSTDQLQNLVSAIESQPDGRKILQPLAEMVEHPTMANLTVHEGAMLQRKLLVPFTSDVNGFVQLGREMFVSALADWSMSAEGIVLLDEIKYLVRAMSAKRLLGAVISKEDNLIIEQTLIAIKASTTSLSPLPSGQFLQAKNRYRLFSQQLVNENRFQILESLQAGYRQANFISEIIKNMTDYTEGKNPDDYIHHPLVTSSILAIATLDGIYTNLTAILLQLLIHPVIAEQLLAECLQVSPDGLSIPDDILKNKNRMPYLHAVYMEGLRFNSSLPILARYSQQAIHVSEATIPASSSILINLRAMHFDKNQWGDDADDFVPERFLRPETKDIQLGKAPFMPFSTGQRICPGMRVGEVMIKLFLTEYLLNYRMTALPNQAPPHVANTSLAPDPGPGYRVMVTRNQYDKEIKNAGKGTLYMC